MYEIKKYIGLNNDVKEIRSKVFIEEQGFKDEFDDIDNTASHLVLYIDNVPVGTCRYFYDELKQTYILGRLAILRKYRGCDFGSMLVKYAENGIKETGGSKICLHSQVRAVNFYEKNGYKTFGGIENEEYCPHIWMKKEQL